MSDTRASSCRDPVRDEKLGSIASKYTAFEALLQQAAPSCQAAAAVASKPPAHHIVPSAGPTATSAAANKAVAPGAVPQRAPAHAGRTLAAPVTRAAGPSASAKFKRPRQVTAAAAPHDALGQRGTDAARSEGRDAALPDADAEEEAGSRRVRPREDVAEKLGAAKEKGRMKATSLMPPPPPAVKHGKQPARKLARDHNDEAGGDSSRGGKRHKAAAEAVAKPAAKDLPADADGGVEAAPPPGGGASLERRIPARLLPWACPCCTLLNAGAAKKCAACKLKREAAVAAPGVGVSLGRPGAASSSLLKEVLDRQLGVVAALEATPGSPAGGGMLPGSGGALRGAAQQLPAKRRLIATLRAAATPHEASRHGSHREANQRATGEMLGAPGGSQHAAPQGWALRDRRRQSVPLPTPSHDSATTSTGQFGSWPAGWCIIGSCLDEADQVRGKPNGLTRAWSTRKGMAQGQGGRSILWARFIGCDERLSISSFFSLPLNRPCSRSSAISRGPG